jgi:hypothetical protein
MISLPRDTVISQGFKPAFFLAVAGAARRVCVATDSPSAAHLFHNLPTACAVGLRSVAASRLLRAVAFHFFIGGWVAYAIRRGPFLAENARNWAPACWRCKQNAEILRFAQDDNVICRLANSLTFLADDVEFSPLRYPPRKGLQEPFRPKSWRSPMKNRLQDLLSGMRVRATRCARAGGFVCAGDFRHPIRAGTNLPCAVSI